MFTTIQTPNAGNADLLDQMFRLRKRVFADELAWDVPVKGDLERDEYDDINPIYLVWCSDDRKTLYGSVRLLPTTGPTLLFDVFRNTFNDEELSAPGIWEATRLCVDKEAIARDFPDMKPARAFGLMMSAITELALGAGTSAVVANHEPHVGRLYKSCGAVLDKIGEADGFGKRPVCCSVFEISTASHASIRNALQLDLPLLGKDSSPTSNTIEHLLAAA